MPPAPPNPVGPVARALLSALVVLAACGRGDAHTSGETGGATVAAADTGAFRPVSVGDLAPAYAAATLAGDTARVGPGAGAGGRATLVNVWATWCTSCREEMADLEALHRDYGPRGLRVLAVSVDNAPAARVRRYVERERLTFAVAHDPEGRVQDAFGVVGVPETYLVDAGGRVRWKRAGNVHGVVPEARAAVEAALR